MADAMVDYYAKGFNHANTTWALSAIAMMNSGGIRASIKKGLSNIINVSYINLLEIMLYFLNYKLGYNKTSCKLLLLQIVLLPLSVPLLLYTEHYQN